MSNLQDGNGQRTTLDDAIRIAESLAPRDRLRLIERLCRSMPVEPLAGQSPADRSTPDRSLPGRSPAVGSPPAWQTPSGPPRDRRTPYEQYRDATSELRARLHEFSKCEDAADAKLYSAPRRFDLATIMVVMAAYALLFSAMTLLDFTPLVKLYIAGLLTLVGASQPLLLGVWNPRAASIYVGAAAHTVASVAIASVDMHVFPGSFFFIVIINGLIGGGIFGYLAGALVAGVFLVADLVRKRWMARQEGATREQSEFSFSDVADETHTPRGASPVDAALPDAGAKLIHPTATATTTATSVDAPR